MKEKYVRPMIEKIAFDSDVVTASDGTFVAIASGSVGEGCTVNKNGKFTFNGHSHGCGDAPTP